MRSGCPSWRRPEADVRDGPASGSVRRTARAATAPRLCGNRPAERPGRSWRRSSSPRSTSWPTKPSATPRSTPGSARRSPSWCGATASKTSAAPFAASRSTSCRWRPGRSTRSPSTKPIWPAGGSPCCRSSWLAALARAVVLGVRGIYRVVHEILHPQVDRQQIVPSDTYWAALRKIHRMRKPVFMGSLWLRARFDVEYLGLPLPTAPPGIAGAVADGDRPRLHRGDPPGPDHRRAGPPPAPGAAGMGLALARSIRLDLRRAAGLSGPRDPLPGQSRRRGAAGLGGRVHPRSRRHRHARPVDRAA